MDQRRPFRRSDLSHSNNWTNGDCTRLKKRVQTKVLVVIIIQMANGIAGAWRVFFPPWKFFSTIWSPSTDTKPSPNPSTNCELTLYDTKRVYICIES
jgi:hypothetical protein